MSSLGPTPSRSARWPLCLAGFLFLAALVLAAGLWWRAHRPRSASGAGPLSNDPRLTFDTPYRNVRPEVRYVGDEACADCHPGVCDSYHRHPMGRSLGPAVAPSRPGSAAERRPARFEALGFHYAAERRGDRLFHRETVPAPAGETGDTLEAEARFVLGSGTRGESYLVAEDGYVFQSPVSWYRQKGIWDLAPSYRERNQHFDRPVVPACLFCHCNRVEPVEHTINRYREPLFRGEAIGCERCHGPGELHVRRQRAAETVPGDRDDTIVNPSSLEPSLREAVCQQCHLQGQVRVLRRGRGVFDYRPGLPLQQFWAVFEFSQDAGGPQRAVGQVEQMHQSRCFLASGGALGCSSCHDAHWQPPEKEKAAYFAARCASCHRDRGCSLPLAARQQKGDDCAACHMPRLTTADIIHVAATDHRILRQPDPSRSAERFSMLADPQSALLVPFHGDLRPGDPETDRDLGVAVATMAGEAPAGPMRNHFSALALPLLEKAARDADDDLDALEWLGATLRFTEQPREALTVYERVLARAPERERTLAEAGMASSLCGRADDALGYWRRAVAVNPRRWRYHYEVAQLLSERHQRAEALAECAAALRLNPAHVETRVVQVACLLDDGRKDEARAAFARLLALKPPREEELRRWFSRYDP
jgi:tetratricopeptide (TPR) repeat protein